MASLKSKPVIAHFPYSSVSESSDYARASIHDSLGRNEAPYGSELIRGLVSVFYVDQETSPEMIEGARRSDEHGERIVVRSIRPSVTTYDLWLAASKLGLGADVGIRPTGTREATVYTR